MENEEGKLGGHSMPRKILDLDGFKSNKKRY